ncbi:cAMP-responsive element modulator [Paragonimus heterotremus]|uniref:cAMP-responsive element modulator n=1 Tax=Paragonimus heterotremus TaxID=100268 RepID=A0A8J4X0Z2_9TREM|nr:cAMP-responsive element modulator [Paragonimus heterotremus]
MSNPSPTDVTVHTTLDHRPPSSGPQKAPLSGRNNFTTFNCMSSGVPSYNSSASSAMSAAAAAAFLLQAATSGPVNGDGSPNTSLPMRRSSTTNFFESPQSSPFSSAVISAAAQQAAFAAAQAIGSSSSSPNMKTPSDLQAAVISLALAANPSSNHPEVSRYDRQEHIPRPSQAVTDLLFLSERHPELLTAHPTLASVFRRRSSTVLPSYFPDFSSTEATTELVNKVPTDPVISGSTQHLTPSDCSGPISSSVTVSRQAVCQSAKTTHIKDGNPFLFSLASLTNQSPKCPRYVPSTCESTNMDYKTYAPVSAPLTYDRGYSSIYKNSPRSDGNLNPLAVHDSYNRNNPVANPSISPTPSSVANDCGPTLCRSTSPLSYSSQSNGASPRPNVSPAPIDTRTRGVLLDSSSDMNSKSSIHYQSVRGCDSEIKHEFPPTGAYSDEPNRKREQRLIKNREAARECRRKKKEYVKCLEARVSLLESQNQQLIEELQKVKAVCFNELCGLGLNSSTAACAAAVLAAVTSVPVTYTLPSASTVTTLQKSPSELGVQPCGQSFHQATHPIDEPSGTPLAPATRARTRRRSTIASSKILDTSVTESADSRSNAIYDNGFSDRIGDISQPLPPFTMGRITHTTNDLKTCLDPQVVLPESVNVCVSTAFDSSADSYRRGDHNRSMQSLSTVSRSATGHNDQTGYHYNTPAVSETTSNQLPGYLGSLPYMAKRTYRSLTANVDGKQTYPNQFHQPESQIKTPRTSNSVAGAAAILAAAAAMVADSESSDSDPRITV